MGHCHRRERRWPEYRRVKRFFNFERSGSHRMGMNEGEESGERRGIRKRWEWIDVEVDR